MPNWCSNTLTVTGPVEEIARFRKESTGYRPKYTPHSMETGEVVETEADTDYPLPELLNFLSLVRD